MNKFWDKVAVAGIDDCWEWTAYKNAAGYGYFERTRRAHRVAFEMTKGTIPDGLIVRHTCDNPACVNPSHLVLGTDKDNVVDMDSRGRRNSRPSYGESNGQAKLSEEEVLAIRKEAGGHRLAAKKYGVSKSMVHNIRTGKNWSHLIS